MKTQFIVSAAAVALFGFANLASAADVYDACMNANDSTVSGAEQETMCKCMADGIGDETALQDEAVKLAVMTQAERDANASDAINAVIGKCMSTPADAG